MIAYEIVHGMGLVRDDYADDPRVHCGRPVRQARGAMRSVWLIVSSRGKWLACGYAETVSRSLLPRVVYESECPPHVRGVVEYTLTRIAAEWRSQLKKEEAGREYKANRARALAACEGRIACIHVEMAAIQAQIDGAQ